MFDLTIYPLSIVAGREQYDLPGLLVMAAPRKATRMRAQDQLLLYCSLRTTPAGNAPAAGLSPAQQQEILQRLAETYFTFSGSVTASLRAVVARLNDFLLNRNLKHAKEGQTVATLNLAAIHGESLIIAHAGPTHSFVLARSQVEHFEDAAQGPGAMRALGLSRQAVPRFYQTTLTTGDLLLFCAEPPAAWTARALANSPQLSLEHLRRRLLSDAGAGLEAAVVRFQPGKGQVNYWKPGEPGAAVPGAENGGRVPAGRAVPSTQRPARPVPAAVEAQPGGIDPAASVSPAAEIAAPAIGIESTPMAVDVPPAEAGSTNGAAIYNGNAVEVDTPQAPAQASDLTPPAEAEAPAMTEQPLDRKSTTAEGLPQADELPEADKLPEADELPLAEEKPEDKLPEANDLPLANELPQAEEPQLASLPRLPESGLPESLEEYLASSQASSQANRQASRPAERPLTPQTTPAQSKTEQTTAEIPARAAQRPLRAGTPQVTREASTRAVNPAAGAPERAKASPAVAGGPAGAGGAASTAAPVRRSNVVKPRQPRAPFAAGLRMRLATLWRRGKVAKSRADGAMAKASGALPKRKDAEGREQPFFNLSPSTMLAISLIVPLMVVTAAATVYFRAGFAEKFQTTFTQAQQYAQQAGQQSDAGLQRQYYEQACSLVKKAEQYGKTNESSAFKQQVCEALDGLKGYVRLAYTPALSTALPASSNITRIVSTLNDVYMLDSSDGMVLRMYRTSSGYELDPKFVCGGGQAGTAVVEPLIDIVAMPPNNDLKGTVMGIDTSGNLVYCSPSRSGFDSRPLALPDNGWGKIRAFTLHNDTLFVLDPSGNAVYRYDGANGLFGGAPHFYFTASVPQMADTIDIAVDDEFLYLLHQDGRMTVCESAGFEYAATKCTDPMPYGDTRAGFEPAPLTFAGSNFAQIITTQPPDPSLYALDVANKAIYHLSLRRLNFQRQYREQTDSDFPLPGSAPTAFSIAPNRRALLAFGNQVFFAPLP